MHCIMIMKVNCNNSATVVRKWVWETCKNSESPFPKRVRPACRNRDFPRSLIIIEVKMNQVARSTTRGGLLPPPPKYIATCKTHFAQCWNSASWIRRFPWRNVSCLTIRQLVFRCKCTLICISDLYNLFSSRGRCLDTEQLFPVLPARYLSFARSSVSTLVIRFTDNCVE